MRRNTRGFTLMELMVVIVIVAILAAVAVPLYINYVRDAQRTEAKGAIGAIISAEQVQFQRTGHYVTGLADIPAIQADPPAGLGIDLTESSPNWLFSVSANGADTDGFKVTATGIAARPSENLGVEYTHSRTAPLVNPWNDNPTTTTPPPTTP
jgi:prepilin-type N-terminal cleavage/methylation domain-containing protein